MKQLNAILFVIMFATLIRGQSPTRMQWSNDGYFSAETPEGLIYVEVQSPHVYLLKGKTAIFGPFAIVYRMPNATKITLEVLRNSLVKDGYFTLDGSVVRVSYSVESAGLEVPNTLDGLFAFTKEGECLIGLNVGKSKLIIPIKITQLNLAKNDPAAAVVENYGEPTERKEVCVKWPDTNVAHTIHYHPEPGNGPIIASHWLFEKTPNMVISVVDSKVYDVGSVSVQNSERLLLEELKEETTNLGKSLLEDIPAVEPKKVSFKESLAALSIKDLEKKRREMVEVKIDIKSGKIDPDYFDRHDIRHYDMVRVATRPGKHQVYWRSEESKKKSIEQINFEFNEILEIIKTAKQK